MAEKRRQLAELQDKRRGVSAAYSEAATSIEYLNGELLFVRRQLQELESDIAVLRESNKILESTVPPQVKLFDTAPTAPGEIVVERLSPSGVVVDWAVAEKSASASATVGQVVPGVLVERGVPGHADKVVPVDVVVESVGSVEAQHEQISQLRAHLERLMADKISLQERQQTLFDKQHTAEQDRNWLLSSLQDDRKGINDLRLERLRLGEERCTLQRDIGQAMQDIQRGVLPSPDATNGHPPVSEMAAPLGASVGGVRVPTRHDTPLAFADSVTAAGDCGTSPTGDRSMSLEDRTGPDVGRHHWTRFESGANPVDVGSAPGMLNGNGGITEWAGWVRDFRASRP